jgi:hypothetical protein
MKMKTYFIVNGGEELKYVLFECDSLKAAKAWATRNRYYNCGRLKVPCIYIRLIDGRVELASVGEYNRRTGRTKWTNVY